LIPGAPIDRPDDTDLSTDSSRSQHFGGSLGSVRHPWIREPLALGLGRRRAIRIPAHPVVECLSQGARLVSNITQNLNEAGKDIAAIIDHAIAPNAAEVEVTDEAEQAWRELLDSGTGSLLGSPDCTPGYYNNEGQNPTPANSRNVAGYPSGPAADFEYIDKWRSSGDFEGLEFR
jgi:hypothetical protein